MISDVVGNDPQFIASGPTVPDLTTPLDSLDLLASLGVRDVTPPSVLALLEQQASTFVVHG